MISPDDARALGAGAVPALVSFAAWLKSRRADKQTRAIGNGFADSVLNSLSRLEAGQKRHDRKLKKLDQRMTAVENRDSASDPNPPAAG